MHMIIILGLEVKPLDNMYFGDRVLDEAKAIVNTMTKILERTSYNTHSFHFRFRF